MRVYILTEGSSNIGFGHITRMLSIYKAFKLKGINPKLIVNGDTSVLDLVKEADFEIFNWTKNERKLLEKIKKADVVIVDSYLANIGLYEKISKTVKLSVYYDDNNRIEYPCGIVINGNIYAKDLNYPRKDCIEYLLGLEYLPLRKEFLYIPEKEIKEKIKNIMITFGGDDIRNMTPKILKILTKYFPNKKKNVIIGKGFNNIKEIENIVDKNTELIYYPDVEKLKQVMLNSDLAISAGGQTLYELARIGVPTIAISVAENQDNNIKSLMKVNFLANFLTWLDKYLDKKILKQIERLENKAIREKISKLGRILVDGKGSIRIVNKLLYRFINYRKVKNTDIWEILELSNQKTVRNNSLNTRSISKLEHKNWFSLVNKDFFFVAELDNKIIGQCRIEKKDNMHFISVSVDENFRNMGIGKNLIKQVLKEFFSKNINEKIYAIVKNENISSIKLFKKFNFKQIGNYKDNFLLFELSGDKYYENS